MKRLALFALALLAPLGAHAAPPDDPVPDQIEATAGGGYLAGIEAGPIAKKMSYGEHACLNGAFECSQPEPEPLYETLVATAVREHESDAPLEYVTGALAIGYVSYLIYASDGSLSGALPPDPLGVLRLYLRSASFSFNAASDTSQPDIGERMPFKLEHLTYFDHLGEKRTGWRRLDQTTKLNC